MAGIEVTDSWARAWCGVLGVYGDPVSLRDSRRSLQKIILWVK